MLICIFIAWNGKIKSKEAEEAERKEKSENTKMKWNKLVTSDDRIKRSGGINRSVRSVYSDGWCVFVCGIFEWDRSGMIKGGLEMTKYCHGTGIDWHERGSKKKKNKRTANDTVLVEERTQPKNNDILANFVRCCCCWVCVCAHLLEIVRARANTCTIPCMAFAFEMKTRAYFHFHPLCISNFT